MEFVGLRARVDLTLNEDWDPPAEFGNYVRLGEAIGSGGLGNVYVVRNKTTDAEDSSDAPLFALKAVRRSDTCELDGIRQLWKKFPRDEHIVRINHVAETEEHLYYVMALGR